MFRALHDWAFLPERAHAGDAGFDLHSAQRLTLAPGGFATVDTGVAVDLPEGSTGLVCPRSGLAAKHGVTVLNSPGVVDAGYRGEVKVVLINFGRDPFEIVEGDRIAQLVVVEHLSSGSDLRAPQRGSSGFGSTGR